MENKAEYHGKPLTEEELSLALKELGIENKLGFIKNMRGKFNAGKIGHTFHKEEITINTGFPKNYTKDASLDNRSAFGNALLDIVQLNRGSVAVFDCDLAPSVKTEKIEKEYPENFSSQASRSTIQLLWLVLLV